MSDETNETDKRADLFLRRSEMRDIEESDLDDLVHDAFDVLASKVNNAGENAQAEVLREAGFIPAETDEPDEAVRSIFSTRASEVNNSGLELQVSTIFASGMDEAGLLKALDTGVNDPGIS